MKKYYLMAIEKGHVNAMYELGLYYEKIEKDYILMEKYYLMAIEKKSRNATKNLKKYYRSNNNTHKLLKLYKKTDNQKKLCGMLINYFGEFVENNETNKIVLKYLKDMDDSLLPNSLKILKRMLNKEISLLEMHINYSMNSQGFEEAKKDFYKQLSLFEI